MKNARTESRRASDVAFEAFWNRYPRKVGKMAAKRKWDSLRPQPELIAAMNRALDWQIQQWSDPQFTPYPATWLHQGRWMDEPATPPLAVKQRHGGVDPRLLVREAAPLRDCPHVEPCSSSLVCQRKRTEPEKYPLRERMLV